MNARVSSNTRLVKKLPKKDATITQNDNATVKGRLAGTEIWTVVSE